ncbi:hypothetical protein [Nocardiopsis valliformis]|uniref:hypothetical protein n=1 Tax=Nocardiopsis valliformis TaxID=239974 RepID=UPI00034935F8|nr:hypothetical protein [Nocardiopsis valliformis]
MRPSPEDLDSIEWFFATFLHQDWTINGESLAEVFEGVDGLGPRREGVRRDAVLLLESGLGHEQLDRILWHAAQPGYEPEYEGFEDWRAALREIVRLCDLYRERARSGRP